jgi:hypothetical protein
MKSRRIRCTGKIKKAQREMRNLHKVVFLENISKDHLETQWH